LPTIGLAVSNNNTNVHTQRINNMQRDPTQKQNAYLLVSSAVIEASLKNSIASSKAYRDF